jgi:hypothetical protein
MDQLFPFDALVIPSDDRAPHLVRLMSSPMNLQSNEEPYRGGRMPHPEVFMDYIAEGMGPGAWSFHVRYLPVPINPSLAKTHVASHGKKKAG